MSVLCTQLFGPSVKRLCTSNTFVCGFIVERTGRGEGVGSAKQSLKPPEVYGENMTAYKKHTQKTATRFAPTGFSLTPAFCVSVCLFVCLCLWLLLFLFVVFTHEWLKRCFVLTWLVPPETAAVSAQVVCAPYNHAQVYSVTLFEATYVGCTCIYLSPATCIFGRMTGIFHLLQQ